MEMKNDILQVPLFSVCSAVGELVAHVLHERHKLSFFADYLFHLLSDELKILFLVSVIQMKFLCKWVGL